MEQVTCPIVLREEQASTCLALIETQIDKLKRMRVDAPEWDLESIDESIRHHKGITEALSRQLYPNAERWKK